MASWLSSRPPGGAGIITPTGLHFCPTYGKWVGVGYINANGIAIESVDGIVWTVLTTGFETNNQFLAVSGIDLPVSRGHIVIVTKSNTDVYKIMEMDSTGTWTEVETGIGLANTQVSGNRFAYLPGIGFCLLCVVTSGPVNVRVKYTSNDGVTWDGPGSISVGTQITIKPGQYFVMWENGISTNNYISYSADGATWNDVEVEHATGSIAFLEGVTPISIGELDPGVTGAAREGSPTFADWIILSVVSAEFFRLFYHFGIGQLVRVSLTESAVSDDGIAWTSVTLPLELEGTSISYNGVIFDKNTMLFLSGSSKPLLVDTIENFSNIDIVEPENLVETSSVTDDNDLVIIQKFELPIPPEDILALIVVRNNDIIVGIAEPIINDEYEFTDVFDDVVVIPPETEYDIIVFEDQLINLSPPFNLQLLYLQWNNDEVHVVFTFDLSNVSEQEVSGILIVRNDNIVGAPLYIGDGTYTFEEVFDSVDNPSGTTYTVYVFSNTLNLISPPSEELVLEIPAPNVVMEMSGGIDLGGAAEIVFMLDPSGIYTIVKDKRHDTLYERMTEITSNNVKIPDPFFKTGYVKDQPSGEY